MSRHSKRRDHQVPQDEREEFIRANAVSLVNELEERIERYRKHVRWLENSRNEMKQHMAWLWSKIEGEADA